MPNFKQVLETIPRAIIHAAVHLPVAVKGTVTTKWRVVGEEGEGEEWTKDSEWFVTLPLAFKARFAVDLEFTTFEAQMLNRAVMDAPYRAIQVAGDTKGPFSAVAFITTWEWLPIEWWPMKSGGWVRGTGLDLTQPEAN